MSDIRPATDPKGEDDCDIGACPSPSPRPAAAGGGLTMVEVS